jgi:hypothetical protein
MRGNIPLLNNRFEHKGRKNMGKRLIQAATITCMLLVVMEIGSRPVTQATQGSTLKVIADDPVTLFPALKSVFQ